VVTRARQIVPLLLAGDIQARAVSNNKAEMVEIRLVDGGKVLWGVNNEELGPWWAWMIIDPDGETHAGLTGVAGDAEPEEVARLIATFNYPAPLEFPIEVEEE
jgi:hypothetical protein